MYVLEDFKLSKRQFFRNSRISRIREKGLFRSFFCIFYGINTILWHKSCIFVYFSQPNGKSFG